MDERLALSRRLTRAVRGEAVDAPAPAMPARVVALTGAGGVGKSSLTGKLVAEIRSTGQRVAVLACDPESPVTGGALLGDRFRMGAAPDDGVFIRSLAAAGGGGALARHLPAAIAVLESAGFGVILLETVGAGQGDTAVRQLADVLVLLLQPETGDDLQWEKAGLLEVADVVAIHKADLPGAERVEAQLLAMLALSTKTAPPVLRVSSRTGAGVAELWQTIAAMPLRRGERDPARLLRLAQEMLAARFDEGSSLVAAWRRGEMSDAEAARRLLEGGP